MVPLPTEMKIAVFHLLIFWWRHFLENSVTVRADEKS